MKRPKRHQDLREACIAEGTAIVAADGVEKLSLREVARRLGVSHQAPYRHFPSRDHILAEIVARAFDGFAQFLDAHPKTEDPEADLAQMGRAYLDYATTHPLEYRLMFGTALPDPALHPAMTRQAKHGFVLLCDALKRRAERTGQSIVEAEILLDALFIWSGLHGLASISSSSASRVIGLDTEMLAGSHDQILRRFKQGIDGTG